MSEEHLVIEKRNTVAIVTLNRPEIRNALSDEMIEDLTRTFLELDADAEVRAVVLAGAGKAFCAGADLNAMLRSANHGYEQNLAAAQRFARMLATLDRMSKPTVARVHGPAYAGGAGLVAACDIAIGSQDAEFALTEVKLGIAPAVIGPYLVRAMGERLARRYFLSGEKIDAGEAYRLRLLSDVSPPEELDGAVNALLGHLIVGAPQAQAKIKDLIRTVAANALDDALVADTARRIAEIRASAEGREGIASFLEKRKPAWVKDFEAVRVKPPRKKRK
jgi:methylglutaconyl-CoA hydratase